MLKNYMESLWITTRLNAMDSLNVSTRRIGGLRFIKVGRFCVSYSVTATYKAL